jgi:hypothetical protein
MSSSPNREASSSRGPLKPGPGAIIIRLFAVCATVGAWLLLWLSLHGGLRPRLDTRLYEVSGRLVAQQALALLGGGGQITVIARDTAAFKNPATDIQMASFRKALGKAHVTVRSLRQLQVDPLRPIAVPSSDFYEALRDTPKGSVIVSFMGPPVLTPAERSRLKEINPAVVAFCSGGTEPLAELRSLFEQGLLHAAVVDRRAWSAERGAANQQDRPEESFLTLTPANVAELTAMREGSR